MINLVTSILHDWSFFIFFVINSQSCKYLTWHYAENAYILERKEYHIPELIIGALIMKSQDIITVRLKIL